LRGLTLSDVPLVLSDHLDEESLGLFVARFGEDLDVDHVNESLAVVLELTFNSGSVSSKDFFEIEVLVVHTDCGSSV